MKRENHVALDQRGMSLVEILVALMLLAVGIMGVSQMFPGAARGQLRDRMLQTATYLAQEKVEILGNLQWSDAQLSPGRHPAVGFETCGESGKWNRFYQVASMASPLDNLKKVTVTVQWKAAGTNGTLSSVTYVRR